MATSSASRADDLRGLIAGLLFLSESEAPLTVVTLPKEAILPDALRALAGLPADAPAEEWAVNDLLEPLATALPDADDFTREQATGFRAVLDFLEQQLQRAVAYKLGEIRKPLFFIGRQPDRSWLAVQTEAVET